MGLRLQKRLKLFGGFGLNFSKSGISWSVRGPAGSVGSKRYSLRTGISGITYVGGYSKRRRNQTNDSDGSTDGKSSNPIASTIITIIATAIVLLLLYFLIDFIFPGFTTTYIIIASIVIGLEVLYAVFLLFAGLIERRESLTETGHSDTTIESETVTEKKESNKVLSLDLSYAMTVTNICSEIELILTDFQRKYSIKNPFDKTISFPNATADTLNSIPVFDICKAFDFLGLELFEEKRERDILLLCAGFFMIPKIDFTSLSYDMEAIDKINKVSMDFICSVNPLSSDQLLVGPIILDIDKQLKSAYIAKLKELLGVLTTVDFVLNKKENELLEILQSY